MNSLSEFYNFSDNGFTFPAYYRRYEIIFTKRCTDWTDEENVTLLLQELGTDGNTKYANLILPKNRKKCPLKRQLTHYRKYFIRETVFSIPDINV